MLSLSTRLWDFARPEPLPDGPRGALPWAAAPFAKLVADAGVTRVHLDARIPEHRFEEVLRAVRDHGLAPHSIDGLAPQPAELTRHAPSPSRVPLANPDDSERHVSVRLHRKTIERAADAQIPIVVLTPGSIPMPAEMGVPAGERETRAYLTRRALEAPRYVDALRFALDELVPAAERQGRSLAIAIGATLDAVPSFQELRALLDEYRGAPLGAWLDGVAIWTLADCGIRRVDTWGELRTATLGIRIADVRDAREAVPGEGAIDQVAMAKALALPASAARVLDLGADHDLGRVRESISHVRTAWTS